MCLIAYSPKGKLIPRAAFAYAKQTNSDGIGVMSGVGIRKYCGRKSGKRAWRHIRQLAQMEIPYGVHFRWATHGAVGRLNTHPFQSASGIWVMHNGVISETAAVATPEKSDTALFVELFLAEAPPPSCPTAKPYFADVDKFIGWGNKLLVFHPETNSWRICRESSGDWIDGIWYSNTYSIPQQMRPRYGYSSYLKHGWEDEEYLTGAVVRRYSRTDSKAQIDDEYEAHLMDLGTRTLPAQYWNARARRKGGYEESEEAIDVEPVDNFFVRQAQMMAEIEADAEDADAGGDDPAAWQDTGGES